MELTLVVAAYLVYVMTRGLIFSDVSGAGLANAARIISVEQSLGFFWEPGWQSWVLTHVKSLAAILNWTYIFTYWPIIVVAGTALYVVNRPKYYYYRSVVVINLVVALIIFMVFPVTSPYNISQYFVNTMQELGPTFYGSPEMVSFYNAQAAMPSLHFSWTVILGVLFVRTFKGWFKITGILYPIITFLAIMITGNHFIMDAIVGGILALAAFGFMELCFRGGFFRWRRRIIARWESMRRTQYRREWLRLRERLLTEIQLRRTIFIDGLSRVWERWVHKFKGQRLYREVLPPIREKNTQAVSGQWATYRDIWLRLRARLPVRLRRHTATR